MLDDMTRDVTHTVQPYVHYSVDRTVSTSKLTHMLINGIGDDKIDKLLFQSVYTFIISTKRFL